MISNVAGHHFGTGAGTRDKRQASDVTDQIAHEHIENVIVNRDGFFEPRHGSES